MLNIVNKKELANTTVNVQCRLKHATEVMELNVVFLVVWPLSMGLEADCSTMALEMLGEDISDPGFLWQI